MSELPLTFVVNGNDPRMKIAAHAVRGRTPLLDATVIARVTPTGGSQLEIVLKDDGQGTVGLSAQISVINILGC